MIILQANELSHSFGANDLFENVSIMLHAKDRVGLVGPNGVGKTTLLLILAGLVEPTGGSISRQDGLTLGYLRQEAVLTFAGQDNTVYEEMLSVFADLRGQEARLRELEAKMEAGRVERRFWMNTAVSKSCTNTAGVTTTCTTLSAFCRGWALILKKGTRR